jgi:ABC-type antimicrobial peptide transport system permease subunit
MTGLGVIAAGSFPHYAAALVLAMMLLPGIARPLFWLALVASSVISHAPHAVRHRRVFG